MHRWIMWFAFSTPQEFKRPIECNIHTNIICPSLTEVQKKEHLFKSIFAQDAGYLYIAPQKTHLAPINLLEETIFSLEEKAVSLEHS